jgi:hypothetical protein
MAGEEKKGDDGQRREPKAHTPRRQTTLCGLKFGQFLLRGGHDPTDNPWTNAMNSARIKPL